MSRRRLIAPVQRTCVLFAAVALSAAAPPQSASPAGTARPDSAAPAALARRLAVPPLLYGRFTQEKTIRGIRKPLASRGDFLADRDRGVIWRTQAPFAAAVAITAGGLWALEAGGADGSVRRAPIRRGNMDATLGLIRRVLAGDPAGLERDFRIEAGGADSAWTLRLAPKDGTWARFLRSVTLSGGARVEQVEYLESNGDRTRIDFTGVEEGAGGLADWAAAAFRDQGDQGD